jgi:hypothetical protein
MIMIDSTADETTLYYSRAIKAAWVEMESRHFDARIDNAAPDNTVVFFENAKARYGIVLEKQSGSKGLVAYKPFALTHFGKGKDLKSKKEFEMPMDAPQDDDSVKSEVKRWLDALLPE